MKNKELFAKNMAVLSEIHDREITESLMSIFWQVLEPFPDDDCARAFDRIIKTSKFFPKPADFIEFLQSDDERSVLAWAEVNKAVRSVGNYQSVKFSDPVIHSCLEAMGGWHKVCDWQESEIKWKRKEFESLYKAMATKGKHPEYLPGVCEIDNHATGFGFDKPVMIGGGDEIQKLSEGEG